MNSLKKVFATLTALTMVLSFAACEKQVSVSPETSLSASTEASVSTETSVSEPTPEPEPVKEYVETPIIVFEDEGYSVYVLKGEEQVGSYRVNLPNLGTDRFAYGDYIFYREYQTEENTVDDHNRYSYKAYNYKTGEDKLLACGEWSGCVDIYKGKVVVTVYNYYAGQYMEYYFDEKTMEAVDGGTGLWDDIPEAYNNFVKLNNRDYFKGFCAERVMDENGYVLVRKDGNLYSFDGNAVNEYDEISEQDKENAIVIYLNDNCIIYETHDGYNYSTRRLVDQSLHTGRRTVISSSYRNFITVEDDILYFIEDEDSEYGLPTITLCSYDAREHLKTKLVTKKANPGTWGEYPFTDVTVSNGTIYAVSNDGEKKDTSILLNGEFKQLGIDAVNYRDGSYKIGYVSTTAVCDLCKKEIGGYYGEYPILGAEYGDKADVISAACKAKIEDYAKVFIEHEPYKAGDASECEEIGHGEERGSVTYDSNISRVTKLGNYVTVESSDYWYGGGAHGMPFHIENLYDLRTGEEVFFKDIYTGTEEDLKKTVAQATKESFEYYAQFEPDRNPFDFYDDPDELYQTVYESVTVDSIDVSYHGKWIIVVFPPYDLGSYASGFKEISIPCSDLGITAFE